MRLKGISTFREQRAQVAIEYILIVGLLLSMILIVFPYALKENELNKALAAARDGAVYGASLRGVGFRGSGVSEMPQGIIKIQKIELIDTGSYNGLKEYRLEIYIIAPAELQTSSISATIRNQALSYIYYAFNGNWPSGTVSRVNTNYYSFTAGSEWV